MVERGDDWLVGGPGGDVLRGGAGYDSGVLLELGCRGGSASA